MKEGTVQSHTSMQSVKKRTRPSSCPLEALSKPRRRAFEMLLLCFANTVLTSSRYSGVSTATGGECSRQVYLNYLHHTCSS
jgi:hypothetical protein